MTVMVMKSVLFPALAVMMDLPGAMAITLPVLDIITTSSLDECQLTVLSVASAGSTVAVRTVLSPSVISKSSWSMVIFSTDTLPVIESIRSESIFSPLQLERKRAPTATMKACTNEK